MTDDIRHTRFHKSGKLLVWNSCATLPFKLFHSGKIWPRRWCGAGSPSALMVLLRVALVVLFCVPCVAGIGARAHRGSLDAQTIKTPYDQRVTSQTYDTEYMSSVILSSSIN